MHRIDRSAASTAADRALRWLRPSWLRGCRSARRTDDQRTPQGRRGGRGVRLPDGADHPEAADRRSTPTQLCRSVMVENIDPEGNNSGVLAACRARAARQSPKPPPKFCAKVIDKLLDPAGKLFLDKVVPVAQQLACVASSSGGVRLPGRSRCMCG